MTRVRPFLVAAIVLLSLSVPTGAQDSASVTVNALAVGQTSDGTLVGSVARVEAEVLAGGSGRVFVDTRPLSETDMQGSARLAARVAADTLGLDWRDYDYLVAFRSGSTVIGGPSAGGVMGLALTTALWNLEHPEAPWTIDPGVAATGTINPDGTIGPVGGIPAKASGAARGGLDTVLYPAGQEITNDGDDLVRMRDHCANIGIDCISTVHLVQLIEAATGQRIERPDVPVPDTSDLPQLQASVEQQMAALRDGLAAAEARFTSGDSARTALDQAAVDLAAAEAELADDRYYVAATQAFRGRIQLRSAEAIMDLQDDPRRETVLAHIDACADSIAALDVPRAQDWTAVQAIAAAQVRVEQAQELEDNARALLAAADSIAGWEIALAQAAFCQERVATVVWWSGLPDLFPAGSDIGDLEATARDILDRARDMVIYAEAVQGESGQAGIHLSAAQRHIAADRFEAAILEAIEAESFASLTLQLVGGDVVPDAVEAEALAGASRAVDRARLSGDEPVLSIALIELASISPEADALADLWTARGMALAPDSTVPLTPTITTVSQQDLATIVASAASFFAGISLVTTIWMATRRQP